MRAPPPFGVGRAKAQDRLDEWIAAVAPGRSFLDLGGIRERGGNERASWAQRCGAKRVAIADQLPLAHHLWGHFQERLRACRIRGIELRAEVDLEGPGLEARLGRHDIVCAPMLLHHAPNPVQTLLNLRPVAAEYLIAGAPVVPDVVENEEGRVAFPASSALFLPALRGRERAVLRRHYLERLGLDLDTHAPEGDAAYAAKGVALAWPYWWFFTKSAFERALDVLEMRLLDRHTWQDHAHVVFLRRT